jgi:ABC-type sugar transport system ATPase subunit
VPFLEFDAISKRFFGIPALREVSLSLERGSVLGLIGENGAGKSTLMNILGGVVRPDSGAMRLEDHEYTPLEPRDALKRGVGFIHQELNLFSNLSVAENLFLGAYPRVQSFLGSLVIDRAAMRRKSRELLESLELDIGPDTTLEKLSPGERQLVEIAKALGANANTIIFDEPTTSLTARETEKLFGVIERLRRDGRAIIYISHVLGDVRRLCDQVVVLRDGKRVAGGPVAEFPVERMISAMVGRPMDQLYPPAVSAPTTEPALELRGLTQPGILENVSLRVHRGEVVGLYGLMGAGRTELARAVFGLDPLERGEVIVCGRPLPNRNPRAALEAGVAFVTENRREEGLLLELPILENVALSSLEDFAGGLGVLQGAGMNARALEVAQSLRVKSTRPETQAAKALSGGNQQKVVISKWVMTDPRVFVLDEPTRGIDVGAKYEVYGIVRDLAARGAGVLMISSEIEELIGLCDRILVMVTGEIGGEFARTDFDRERILRAAFGETRIGSSSESSTQPGASA